MWQASLYFFKNYCQALRISRFKEPSIEKSSFCLNHSTDTQFKLQKASLLFKARPRPLYFLDHTTSQPLGAFFLIFLLEISPKLFSSTSFLTNFSWKSSFGNFWRQHLKLRSNSTPIDWICKILPSKACPKLCKWFDMLQFCIKYPERTDYSKRLT